MKQDKVRSYVSIDIETTGIDLRSEILQISCVYDDGKPISELKTLDIAIKYESMSYCEPYAMGMNAELLKKMMSKDFPTVKPATAVAQLVRFLKEVLTETPDQKTILLAGKNLASFDVPMLRSFISRYHEAYLYEFNRLIGHKTLDVGSMYYDVFGDNVNLSKINELVGRPAVSHNALDDAFDVVHAVRYKSNMFSKES